MSKGSKPRPLSISQQEYDTRWDAIFGRDIEDVLEHQLRENALQALVDESQRLGLYDMDHPNPMIRN
jgi:hypothetical protein